ncbi:MAG TPA: DUF420 domain-containing protein [bacterium]|nr:DUF420 domain-containing protein [bacterium]
MLPTINAILNGLSAVLLSLGYGFIRRGNMRVHKRFMIAAFGVSALFLISYLIYHAQVGSTAFTGQSWIRPVYFFILITHIILAAVIVPLAIITLIRALRERFALHKKIARWTLPVWLYVSVTGVLVYVMLYHLT